MRSPRPVATTGTCVFLLLGSATLHLRPSESPPPAALPPGLGGASTAPFSVDADGEYDIQVSVALLLLAEACRTAISMELLVILRGKTEVEFV